MKVAILMGGYSKEREISLISGNNVYQTLSRKKIDCFSFDMQKNNLHKLFQKNFDKAFIILHGRGGEDGFIQKKLEEKNIAYTGSNVAVSNICIDKEKTKNIWQKYNLPTAPFVCACQHKYPPAPHFDLPWIIKPTLEGSSLGVSIVTKENELESALERAYQYNHRALIEKYIKGREYTVAILNDTALPIIEISCAEKIFDYHAKYHSQKTRFDCPARLSEDSAKEIQQLAHKAFKALGAKTWGRIDLMMDNNQKPYLLEINTVPGLTPHSLVPKAAKAAGLSFYELTRAILFGA